MSMKQGKLNPSWLLIAGKPLAWVGASYCNDAPSLMCSLFQRQSLYDDRQDIILLIRGKTSGLRAHILPRQPVSWFQPAGMQVRKAILTLKRRQAPQKSPQPRRRGKSESHASPTTGPPWWDLSPQRLPSDRTPSACQAASLTGGVSRPCSGPAGAERAAIPEPRSPAHSEAGHRGAPGVQRKQEAARGPSAGGTPCPAAQRSSSLTLSDLPAAAFSTCGFSSVRKAARPGFRLGEAHRQVRIYILVLPGFLIACVTLPVAVAWTHLFPPGRELLVLMRPHSDGEVAKASA